MGTDQTRAIPLNPPYPWAIPLGGGKSQHCLKLKNQFGDMGVSQGLSEVPANAAEDYSAWVVAPCSGIRRGDRHVRTLPNSPPDFRNETQKSSPSCSGSARLRVFTRVTGRSCISRSWSAPMRMSSVIKSAVSLREVW